MELTAGKVCPFRAILYAICTAYEPNCTPDCALYVDLKFERGCALVICAWKGNAPTAEQAAKAGDFS